MLKDGIMHSKKENDCNINQLVKVHHRKLEEVKHEKNYFRNEFKAFDATLLSKNVELKIALECLWIMDNEISKTKSSMCSQCDKTFDRE